MQAKIVGRDGTRTKTPPHISASPKVAGKEKEGYPQRKRENPPPLKRRPRADWAGRYRLLTRGPRRRLRSPLQDRSTPKLVPFRPSCTPTRQVLSAIGRGLGRDDSDPLTP